MMIKNRFFAALQVAVVLIAVMTVTGCAQFPATEGAQSAAQELTKEAREGSLYAQCRVRPVGSWFDFFSDRPTIACLEWRSCLLYNNQAEAPTMLECE